MVATDKLHLTHSIDLDSPTPLPDRGHACGATRTQDKIRVIPGIGEGLREERRSHRKGSLPAVVASAPGEKRPGKQLP